MRRLAIALTVLACSVCLTAGASASQIRVAVSYFDNTSGKAELEPLKKGLAEMLITDLAVSKDIVLVERGRLNELLTEISLQKSPYFDNASAAKLGKGLGASYIVTGSYIVQGTVMRVDARIVDVESSEIALSTKAEGDTSAFLDVQRKLATALLEGIGSRLNLLERKRIGQGSTRDYGAFKAYAKGLDQLDGGKTEEALRSLETAVKKDPAFEVAKSLRDRVEKLAKTFDLKAQASQIDTVATHLAGDSCECSYIDAAGDPPRASWSDARRLARRVNGTRDSAATTTTLMKLGTIAIGMAKLGMFEEVDSLLAPLGVPELIELSRDNLTVQVNGKRLQSRCTGGETATPHREETRKHCHAALDYYRTGPQAASTQFAVNAIERKLIALARYEPEQLKTLERRLRDPKRTTPAYPGGLTELAKFLKAAKPKVEAQEEALGTLKVEEKARKGTVERTTSRGEKETDLAALPKVYEDAADASRAVQDYARAKAVLIAGIARWPTSRRLLSDAIGLTEDATDREWNRALAAHLQANSKWKPAKPCRDLAKKRAKLEDKLKKADEAYERDRQNKKAKEKRATLKADLKALKKLKLRSTCERLERDARKWDDTRGQLLPKVDKELARIKEDEAKRTKGQADGSSRVGFANKFDVSAIATWYCAAYQVASWSSFRQLKLDKAMEWQLKAADLPFGQYEQAKNACMGPMLLESLGVPVDKGMRALIEEATKDPAVFRRLKEELEAAKRLAPKARKAVDKAKTAKTCEHVCPWDH